jgi:hypothetical protein
MKLAFFSGKPHLTMFKSQANIPRRVGSSWSVPGHLHYICRTKGFLAIEPKKIIF